MGFLEQPFSTPIIYNLEKGGNFGGGKWGFPPIITIRGPIIYTQGPIIYNRIPDYI